MGDVMSVINILFFWSLFPLDLRERIQVRVIIMKKIVSVLFLLLLLVSCGQNISVEETPSSQNSKQTITQTSEQVSEKIAVTASIIPLASVINTIWGEYVEVNTIVPAGVSPHGFDLSARQMVEIEKSELVFMTGLDGIDAFLETSIAKEKQVYLADGIEFIETAAHSHENEDGLIHDHFYCDTEQHQKLWVDCLKHDISPHTHNSWENQKNYTFDPHVWLGKENIIQIAGKVKDELSQILPEQAEYFSENTQNFERELNAIYADFTAKTAWKTPSEFIVFHDAYNYLLESARIDLSLKVPFSENVLQETGTAHMKELIEEIEIHGVKNVFREPQFSDGNLQTFALEYNLEVGILDPIGIDDSARGYLENLKNNLKNLEQIYE